MVAATLEYQKHGWYLFIFLFISATVSANFKLALISSFCYYLQSGSHCWRYHVPVRYDWFYTDFDGNHQWGSSSRSRSGENHKIIIFMDCAQYFVTVLQKTPLFFIWLENIKQLVIGIIIKYCQQSHILFKQTLTATYFKQSNTKFFLFLPFVCVWRYAIYFECIFWLFCGLGLFCSWEMHYINPRY